MTEAELREGIKNSKIVFGSQVEIKSQSKQYERFTDILCEIMNWDDNDRKALFISDESTLSDFGFEDEDYQTLEKKLGFQVNRDDFIKDILLQMRGIC